MAMALLRRMMMRSSLSIRSPLDVNLFRERESLQMIKRSLDGRFRSVGIADNAVVDREPQEK
jgi:hypothetical protein